MGHQRLGKLPAHRLLPEIVRYLVAGGTPTENLVDQVTEVGQDALKQALKDPVFIEAVGSENSIHLIRDRRRIRT
jgi:hypothetical protein